jgi:hypothetical protein
MLSTLLKHRIYESCIDVFFDTLMKNFNISKSYPRIGDRYSVIYDAVVGDTFYDCIIVPIEQLSFYEDLRDSYRDQGMNINDLAFGIRYSKYVDELGEIEGFPEYESYGETSFAHAELEDIVFHK